MTRKRIEKSILQKWKYFNLKNSVMITALCNEKQ